MKITWQNDPDGYLVATLTATGAVLAVAQSDATGPVQWFSRWIAEGGHRESATLQIDGNTAFVLQGEKAGQGLFVVWAIENGMASNELVLMLLGEGYSSASNGTVSDSTIGDGTVSEKDGSGGISGSGETGETGTIETVFSAIQGQASLALNVKGIVRIKKPLKAKATLQLIARQGTAQIPTGLGMKMTILTDPYRPDVIRDQYLMVWFNGNPNQCKIALQIDDGAEFQPAFTWQNPGTTSSAILKIDGAEIPGDGQSHLIKVSVWQAIGQSTSARATLSDYAKTPTVRPATQPSWCGVTAIRQGETLYSTDGYHSIIGHIGDLTRVEWRHTGAVKIMAKVPVANEKTTGFHDSIISVGYADYDETQFFAEGIGSNIGWRGGDFHNVLFGVAAIHGGQFGPITWANTPVKIKEVYQNPSIAPNSPDDIAGTAIAKAYSTFREEVAMALFAANGWAYPNYWEASPRRDTARMAVDQLLLRIKDIIRKGGSVTLDDLGRFEARWNPARTVRSVAFVASAGFITGTRAGILLTDQQAKASP